jgi:hypothetical protein
MGSIKTGWSLLWQAGFWPSSHHLSGRAFRRIPKAVIVIGKDVSVFQVGWRPTKVRPPGWTRTPTWFLRVAMVLPSCWHREISIRLAQSPMKQYHHTEENRMLDDVIQEWKSLLETELGKGKATVGDVQIFLVEDSSKTGYGGHRVPMFDSANVFPHGASHPCGKAEGTDRTAGRPA